ncbi:MAG: hypothetical protein CMM94_08665 [Rickettsiales bacterium]|nr:hypothetical protein [Rickettsiales bacterium]
MRYSEEQEYSASDLDFVAREDTSAVWQMAGIFVVAIALTVLVIMNPTYVGGTFPAILLVILLLGGAGFYSYLIRRRNLDLVMATEFQNLLFASAASMGSEFCMFIKRDGTIVYSDNGLRTMFPDFAAEGDRALEALLAEGDVSREDADKIFQSLTRNSRERLVFPMRDGEGARRSYIITIDPIKRPSGFFVVRGREYVDARGAVVELPPFLDVLSIEKIQHTLDHCPLGMYVTDLAGQILYANHELDALLSYHQGELSSGNKTLRDLIYQVGDHPIGEYELDDFQGEVLLQRKNGSLLKTYLKQILIRDNEGKVTGSTGYVREYSAD